jgi:hypothetical protein
MLVICPPLCPTQVAEKADLNHPQLLYPIHNVCQQICPEVQTVMNWVVNFWMVVSQGWYLVSFRPDWAWSEGILLGYEV